VAEELDSLSTSRGPIEIIIWCVCCAITYYSIPVVPSRCGFVPRRPPVMKNIDESVVIGKRWFWYLQVGQYQKPICFSRLTKSESQSGGVPSHGVGRPSKFNSQVTLLNCVPVLLCMPSCLRQVELVSARFLVNYSRELLLCVATTSTQTNSVGSHAENHSSLANCNRLKICGVSPSTF
jgi:hypothetical protein